MLRGFTQGGGGGRGPNNGDIYDDGVSDGAHRYSGRANNCEIFASSTMCTISRGCCKRGYPGAALPVWPLLTHRGAGRIRSSTVPTRRMRRSRKQRNPSKLTHTKIVPVLTRFPLTSAHSRGIHNNRHQLVRRTQVQLCFAIAIRSCSQPSRFQHKSMVPHHTPCLQRLA